MLIVVICRQYGKFGSVVTRVETLSCYEDELDGHVGWIHACELLRLMKRSDCFILAELDIVVRWHL